MPGPACTRGDSKLHVEVRVSLRPQLRLGNSAGPTRFPPHREGAARDTARRAAALARCQDTAPAGSGPRSSLFPLSLQRHLTLSPVPLSDRRAAECEARGGGRWQLPKQLSSPRSGQPWTAPRSERHGGECALKTTVHRTAVRPLGQLSSGNFYYRSDPPSSCASCGPNKAGSNQKQTVPLPKKMEVCFYKSRNNMLR